MIEKSNVISTVKKRLKKLNPGQGVDLRTYKRDRSVVILKQEDGILEVIQNGYENETFNIPETKLAKLLQKLLKIEFPRSNKVRIYRLESGIRPIPRKI
ncbi:MAG: hypothetical protein HQL54_04070 [Magnetococcales bacterium]|nr:hypothetical protein [Magnetococcales bacterium]